MRDRTLSPSAPLTGPRGPSDRDPLGRFGTARPLTALLRERMLAMLAAGLSHRRIAAALDLHRSAVDRFCESRGADLTPYCLPPGHEWSGVPRRCPGCGGRLLIVPCILCRDRDAIDRRKFAGR